MLAHQCSWSATLLFVIAISALVSSNPLPDNQRRDEPFNHGPYALRLVSNHPNLTNALFTDHSVAGVSFKQNPDPKTLRPIWAGYSYWKRFNPDATDNLFLDGGAIFLDERMDNNKSLQFVLQYAKGRDEHVPYLNWNWEAGPATTHLWPGNWYVTWGGFMFVRQNDTGKVFLFNGRGPDPKWRLAAMYSQQLDWWYLRSFNSTDPSVPLPKDWEFVNVEVIPFEQVRNGTL
jgi:hypothetical protein